MPRISAIATAVPDLDFEPDYRRWALSRLGEGREGKLYERMANRSGIEHRWSVLDEADARLDEGVGFYGGEPPSTAARMAIYAKEAPELALKAIAGLPELGRVTHLVVASCTGFVAPGIDQIVARRLGLGADVERVLVGFMGCYAAVTALRTARHIVRSEPLARVLVVTVELSSLHHQEEMDLEPLLMGAQFGDGAAAAGERRRTGINSLKVRFNRVFGYYIEISKSNLHAVPSDYHRKQTIAGGERFITPDRPS